MLPIFKLLVVCTWWLRVKGETAQLKGTCDNKLKVEVSYDGEEANYQDITGTLTPAGKENTWAVLKTVTLTDVTDSTKLRLTCENKEVSGNAPGGLLFSIEYGGSYYSTNGAEQNYGYYGTDQCTAGPTVGAWLSQSALQVMYAEPYNAGWTWPCGADGDFTNILTQALHSPDVSTKLIALDDLTYSHALAESAADWAGQLCVPCQANENSPDARAGLIGENVGRDTGFGGAKLVALADAWTAQRANYDGGVVTAANMDSVGQYAQMINADTFEVGCAYAICAPPGASSADRSAADFVLVCLYKAAIVAGSAPYVADPSGCPANANAPLSHMLDGIGDDASALEAQELYLSYNIKVALYVIAALLFVLVLCQVVKFVHSVCDCSLRKPIHGGYAHPKGFEDDQLAI